MRAAFIRKCSLSHSSSPPQDDPRKTFKEAVELSLLPMHNPNAAGAAKPAAKPAAGAPPPGAKPGAAVGSGAAAGSAGVAGYGSPPGTPLPLPGYGGPMVSPQGVAAAPPTEATVSEKLLCSCMLAGLLDAPEGAALFVQLSWQVRVNPHQGLRLHA